MYHPQPLTPLNKKSDICYETFLCEGFKYFIIKINLLLEEERFAWKNGYKTLGFIQLARITAIFFFLNIKYNHCNINLLEFVRNLSGNTRR